MSSMNPQFVEQVTFLFAKYNEAVLAGVAERLAKLQTAHLDQSDIVRVKIHSLRPDYAVKFMPPPPPTEELTTSDCLMPLLPEFLLHNPDTLAVAVNLMGFLLFTCGLAPFITIVVVGADHTGCSFQFGPELDHVHWRENVTVLPQAVGQS
jgi:hypothetical protein